MLEKLCILVSKKIVKKYRRFLKSLFGFKKKKSENHISFEGFLSCLFLGSQSKIIEKQIIHFLSTGATLQSLIQKLNFYK